MTQAVLLRHFAKELLFFLDERHFAEEFRTWIDGCGLCLDLLSRQLVFFCVPVTVSCPFVSGLWSFFVVRDSERYALL